MKGLLGYTAKSALNSSVAQKFCYGHIFRTESVPQYVRSSRIVSDQYAHTTMNRCFRVALVELVLIQLRVQYQTRCQKVALRSVYRSESL